ncbi:hypothetical protein D9M70_451860 [compost metagenome]
MTFTAPTGGDGPTAGDIGRDALIALEQQENGNLQSPGSRPRQAPQHLHSRLCSHIFYQQLLVVVKTLCRLPHGARADVREPRSFFEVVE